MKKLNLLLIISMLAAALLAANPPGKLVRLEVINASGDTVYMRLQGSITGAFYYLTIPRGTKTFTVLVDSYRRTTWACGGVQSSGSLRMTGNVRLKFVQCGKIPVRTVWNDLNGDGIPDWDPNILFSEVRWAPNFGEPTQEKVVFFWGYEHAIWMKLCHDYNCTWWWDDGVTYHSASLWVLVKLPYSTWYRVAYPRGRFMRYRY